MKMSFACVRADVADVARRTDLTEIVEPDQFYVSVQSGVDAYLEDGDATRNDKA